ncbi:YraN family protein [Lachnospiraceae bacterium]|nr:YraN family protein [Lachnospiraceae bacterium]
MAGAKHNQRAKGMQYEKLAAEFLEQKGFQVLQHNFYSRYGEIDLIARDEGYLVFVEVKYRESSRSGYPLEAVDGRKRRKICRTADAYCLRYGYSEGTPCRFDVVGIRGDEIIHILDAFEYVR